MGMGAMTGRAAGFCIGTEPSVVSLPLSDWEGEEDWCGPPVGVRCAWRGRSGMAELVSCHRASGWMRRGEPAQGAVRPDAEQALRTQAEVLQSQLDQVQERLRQVEAQAGKKEQEG
jgi:hypothetical protein